MSLETISDHFPLSIEACGGEQRPGLAAGLSPAELSIRAVHSSNRCFCFLRSVGTSLSFFLSFFLVGTNANIAEIQKARPHLYVIIGRYCDWISYCPFSSNKAIAINAVFAFSRIVSMCLLFSYFLAITKGTHNHCCLQCKGVCEIHLVLKALGKLKNKLSSN